MATPNEQGQADAGDTIDGAATKLKGLFSAEKNQPEESGDTEVDETDVPSGQAPEGVESEEEAETPAEVETLGADQLAELLKYKPEKLVVTDDGEIRFKISVDGEESDANLTDLIERYQRDAHLTNRGKELTNLTKQAEEKLSGVLQMGQQMAQQSNALFESMKKEVLNKYESVDWQTLRVQDPAEYAALQAEMQQTLSRINTAKDESMQAIASQYNSAQEQVKANFQQYLSEQRDAAKALIPNWGPDVQKDVKHFLNSQGFVDQEVNNIFDARMVNIAYQAMLYNKGKSSVSQKLEKKPLPKVLKPGARPDAKLIAQEGERKAKAKLRKSGSVDDAASLLKQRFKR